MTNAAGSYYVAKYTCSSFYTTGCYFAVGTTVTIADVSSKFKFTASADATAKGSITDCATRLPKLLDN